MRCFWCERDATGEVIVESAIYKPKNGVKTLHKPERKAAVCEQHANITARGVMKPPPGQAQARAGADDGVRHA